MGILSTDCLEYIVDAVPPCRRMQVFPMKILHLDSSALGDYSVSRQLSADIVAELKQQAPNAHVSYRDLAAQPLAHWTPAVADADTAEGREGIALVEEFLGTDVLVIGAPMYNFGIPSPLKAWIDRIAVAGKTFRYSANGVEGLATGKNVIVASSRGGVYVDSHLAGLDHQEAYLRSFLGFLGIAEIAFVRAEGISISPENKAQAIDTARRLIPSMVRTVAKTA